MMIKELSALGFSISMVYFLIEFIEMMTNEEAFRKLVVVMTFVDNMFFLLALIYDDLFKGNSYLTIISLLTGFVFLFYCLFFAPGRFRKQENEYYAVNKFCKKLFHI